MKINQNKFVNKILKIHSFLVKASKNKFLLLNWNFVINSFDRISVNNFFENWIKSLKKKKWLFCK